VGSISRIGRTNARLSKISKSHDQFEGTVPEALAGDSIISGPDNLAFFKYKPAKTNDKIIKAVITKIDSMIVKARITVFFVMFLSARFILFK
jgi:hypothetical protein